MFEGLLGNHKLSFDINSQHPIDFFRSNIWQFSKMLDSRIAHHDIQSPELCHGLFEYSFDLISLRDIGFNSESSYSESASFFCYFFSGSSRRDIVDYYVGAVLGET